jgi:hypothetical protein
MPKGKLYMSLLSKRLVSIAASTLALSLVSAAANAQAQIEFLTASAFVGERRNWGDNTVVTTTYTFTSPMILNSIGFATVGSINPKFSYELNGGGFTTVSSLGQADANGFSWYQLGAGQSMQLNNTLKVRTERASPTGDYLSSIYTVTGQNSAANVTYGGLDTGGSPNLTMTNSNIRVSNPGSNVAPEPGSFALALTGGAALLGICVRRRRNAG